MSRMESRVAKLESKDGSRVQVVAPDFVDDAGDPVHSATLPETVAFARLGPNFKLEREKDEEPEAFLERAMAEMRERFPSHIILPHWSASI